MPQRALVYQPGPCPSGDRGLATGIQRGATEEGTRRADARRLCQAADQRNGYSHRRTLKPTATQDGGTSLAPNALSDRAALDVTRPSRGTCTFSLSAASLSNR